MKKDFLILFVAFLLLGTLAYVTFISADNENNNPNRSSDSAITTHNDSEDDEDNATLGDADDEDVEDVDNGNVNARGETEVEIERDGNKMKIKARGINAVRLREMFKERNRFRFSVNESELPENCTKINSAIKCNLNDTRVMVVFAGKSGNIIVQVRGVNATTNIQLYKENESLYGLTINNETIMINYLPDQIREKVRERTKTRLNNTNITLNENGTYEYRAEKEARFLFIFKVREKVSWHIDAETGEIIKEKKPWWGFFARDVKEKELLGESCGTVTPGYNDECCQNKGFSSWNADEQVCV